MYYLQSRYYDARTCRFVNADRYVNKNGDIIGYNLFAYCSNNPIAYIDPTGEGIITSIILIATAVVCYSFVVSSLISDIPVSDDPQVYSVYNQMTDYGSLDFLYFETGGGTILDQTYMVYAEAGVYTETAELNNDSRVQIDALKLSGQISALGAGVGAYLGEVSFVQDFEIFGEEFSISYGLNVGAGAKLQFGKEIGIGFSYGFGWFVSLEMN